MKPLTAAESRLLDRLERGLGPRLLAGPIVGALGGIVFAMVLMGGAGASGRFRLGEQSTAYAGLEAAIGATPAFVLLCAGAFGALGVLLAVVIGVRLSAVRRSLRARASRRRIPARARAAAGVMKDE